MRAKPVQQKIRQSANDPQVQIAEDIAASLAAGRPIQPLMPAESVEVRRSLAVFVIVFDERGAVTASSVALDGRTPALPNGVLASTRRNGEDRFTWQPDEGVRVAAVTIHYDAARPGFVLAGRSLREVEKREDQIRDLVIVGWLVTLVASVTTVLLVAALRPRLGIAG